MTKEVSAKELALQQKLANAKTPKQRQAAAQQLVNKQCQLANKALRGKRGR